MPRGIWTMDSRESMPLSALLSTGTPSTGRRVWAAIMPGRWAAPPAPAMMTSSPRPSASAAYSASQRGVRWAETIRHSWGTSNCSRTSLTCCMVSQSDLLPMTTPTRGLEEDVFSLIGLPLRGWIWFAQGVVFILQGDVRFKESFRLVDVTVCDPSPGVRYSAMYRSAPQYAQSPSVHASGCSR